MLLAPLEQDNTRQLKKHKARDTSKACTSMAVRWVAMPCAGVWWYLQGSSAGVNVKLLGSLGPAGNVDLSELHIARRVSAQRTQQLGESRSSRDEHQLHRAGLLQ